MKHNILIVDDDEVTLTSLSAFLRGEGFFVKTVTSGDEAIALVRQKAIPFSLALIDYHMPEMNGPAVISGIREYCQSLHLVGFSGDDSNESHNEALESGALMFISKATESAKLLAIIHRICREVERRTKPLELPSVTANRRIIESAGIIGASDSLAASVNVAMRVAKSNDCVLIRGENGTGKEVIAKMIHENSSRSRGPFIAINCASIPEALVESELFGHERGAFSGAIAARVGKFQAAQGGTIFLDEIGDMPTALQAKLLRVLQEKEITAVGSNSTKKIDVRVLAATNADLEAKIRDKTFREDLFYRLNVLPVDLAPLRERRADIQYLVAHFMEIENKLNGETKTILDSTVQELEKWPWPGNVRDLSAAIKRLHLLVDEPVISIESLSLLGRKPESGFEHTLDYDSFRFRYEADERRLIAKALERASGVIADAARVLGLRRETLRDKMKVLGFKNETATNRLA
jgi:two-component system, NtrC family, nitrogen regulation response regulator GlnG